MIDWQSTTLAYNRDNKTNHTVKELLMSLYPRYSSHAMGKILFVNPQSLLNKLRSLGIKIETKGHRHPTKWQIFMTIPTNVFDVIPLQEIAEYIGTTVKTVRHYRAKRLKPMKYYKGKIGAIKNPPQLRGECGWGRLI